MDEKTKSEWEKSKRIEEERMKAARNLANHAESKANQAFLAPEKARGFSRDPNVVMASAERMASISIIFTLLGIIFSIFSQIFAIVAEANKLGLAGSGVSMVLGAVQSIGIGVGALTGVIALVCTMIFGRKTHLNVKHIIITAGISVGLIIGFYIVQYLITHSY
ncbi:hypothetical protein IJH26_01705 [Candidatus Saccharibacteria bacterium]|nr:hypothetical protein [Candidatus Saccharibacteria bacterium]